MKMSPFAVMITNIWVIQGIKLLIKEICASKKSEVLVQYVVS